MAAFTTDALGDVNAVIEINEIRKIVDSRPTDRFVFAETRAHRLQRRAGAPDLRMAVHAGLGGRNIREARILYRGMAVAAIEPEPADVMRVAKRNRLLTSLIGARRIVRAPRGIDRPTRDSEDPHQEGQAHLGVRIR